MAISVCRTQGWRARHRVRRRSCRRVDRILGDRAAGREGLPAHCDVMARRCRCPPLGAVRRPARTPVPFRRTGFARAHIVLAARVLRCTTITGYFWPWSSHARHDGQRRRIGIVVHTDLFVPEVGHAGAVRRASIVTLLALEVVVLHVVVGRRAAGIRSGRAASRRHPSRRRSRDACASPAAAAAVSAVAGVLTATSSAASDETMKGFMTWVSRFANRSAGL